MDELSSGIAPNPIHPASSIFSPSIPAQPKIDHLTEIAELARGLHNVSPSGAETVSAKILEHIAALQEGNKN